MGRYQDLEPYKDIWISNLNSRVGQLLFRTSLFCSFQKERQGGNRSFFALFKKKIYPKMSEIHYFLTFLKIFGFFKKRERAIFLGRSIKKSDKDRQRAIAQPCLIQTNITLILQKFHNCFFFKQFKMI